jgi:hypothetical protein
MMWKVRPVLLIAAVLFLGGCFRNHRTYKSWQLYGGGEAFLAKSERTKLYGGFRTPELFIQPAGGFTYPIVWNAQREKGGKTITDYTIDGPGGSSWVRVTSESQGDVERTWWGKRGVMHENFFYTAGALDLVPYRMWFSGHYEIDEKIGWTFGHIGMFAFMYPIGIVARAPAYVLIDAYKVVMTPLALLHYAGRD